MKWFNQIVTALLATTALAAPAPPKASAETAYYNLRVLSKFEKSLDDKLLSVFQDKVGVFSGAPAVSFFPVNVSDNATEPKYQLHTSPIGIVQTVLGLVGSDSLSTLMQISDPYQLEFPDGVKADWSSWDMVERVEGEQINSYLNYVGSPEGTWIAFPETGLDNWTVTWYDGIAVLPQHYMPIEVIYEKVMQG
ncbi:hypothetical protein PpBr36_08973 [Pyricularia pennisetigena]|uniref:hypothetical protein n=1 Tax=Pyricularia pennisetigena TaxID=1578925 RepID=UPI00114EFB46|nr:hypothetical protein PpBr36_08973 [Pyricularia pennisetigena]TLS23799.1 hypothetical protein PpBr36_08973 [Pyricularia pennisetigena]